ncbi:hypothetical protein DL766_003296 [Monosporascus sp. MC13-8B]|uniref:Uncharacterized protein n=1 Tax=Monosporascus cannonballus TaxID=155416 RepID=A0ABY0GVW1_9PEZI|nr:hypothetical protein DL762_010088 [Monosporascus cannonballus]RYO93305.1 hypothetical protein DL763_004404 [Monosporascus cannonballus]RYP33803.1 hypothetical protein DL766_003296 [Monosporascus sp. MC13-8B]
MQPGSYSTPSSPGLLVVLISLTFIPPCRARSGVTDDLHHNYFDPAPAAEDGPPLSAGTLRNPSYLPAQIGGIVGAYALSLVIVASVLLLLAKKRRERLTAADEDVAQGPYKLALTIPPQAQGFEHPPQSFGSPPRSPIKNFSHPTPVEEQGLGPYIAPPPLSTSTLGINPLVDQRVVAADREMAQQQLEEMYKYVMEQEAAKEAGITLERPPSAISPVSKEASTTSLPRQGILKKGKNKPANLDLERNSPEKPESRASSIFSSLMSPKKKKNAKGISISSPIMTPMSGTFPRNQGEEMNVIPPRHYAPASPPPIPGNQAPYSRDTRYNPLVAPITPPDVSPESTQSIDERLGAQFGHSRNASQAPTEPDPLSAVSERSTAPLVGLPSSPKPGANRFPSFPASPKPGATFPTSHQPGATLPASPKPGSTFSRPNAPSAVRTGGTLPLRAYEPALSSPSMQTTKQTTFERAAPLSPSGLRTPWTGAPVPYSPYQPFSPVVPITPSLVTKADRKRMKQLQPKTPTMEMVKSSDEVW